MSAKRLKKRDRTANRLAMMGIIIVVVFLAIAILMRGQKLSEQNRIYQAQEESLDQQIQEEKETSEELKQKKAYVKTKDYIIEKAREIFGLKMPDEIILRPDNTE